MKKHSSLRMEEDEVKSLWVIAYEKIKRAILDGTFTSGERISERKLAKELGISTSPIKHALNRLSYEGLIATIPRKGSYVLRLPPSTSHEVAAIQASLLGVAARFSAQEITEEEIRELRKLLLQMNRLVMQRDLEGLAAANSRFYQMVKRICRSRCLCQILDNLEPLDGKWLKPGDGEEAKKRSTELQGIFEALAYRKRELADERMKNHLLRVMREEDSLY